MATISVTYTFTNGTTADGANVSTNFTDLVNGLSDGSKDISVSAITAAGACAFNGNVTLGNASGDDITFTGSLASSVPIKTNNSFNIGSATLGLAKIYLGNGGAGATCDIISASHSTTREYTVPDCGAAASFVMTQVAQTISGTKTFDGQLIGKGTTAVADAAAGYIGEYIEGTASLVNYTTTDTAEDLTSISLTAGDWDVGAGIVFIDNGATLGEREVLGGISLNTASFTGTTLGSSSMRAYFLTEAEADDGNSIGVMFRRVNVSSTTTVYLVSQATWTGTAPQRAGHIWARRVR